MIPKIIHYCWLSGDTLPDKFQRFLSEWKEKLPDYEFMLWDLNRFDLDSCKWVAETFSVKKYAFAADYIRIFALYNYGGIYMDLDVQVIKSFDDLLDRQFILGYESNKKAIEAGIMGSEKEAPWLLSCLNYYEDKSFINVDGTYNTTPLPYILYSIISQKYKDFLPRILPFDFLTAKSLLTRELMITPNTYTVHHFAGSWTPWIHRFKKKLKEFLGKHVTLSIIFVKNKIMNLFNV